MSDPDRVVLTATARRLLMQLVADEVRDAIDVTTPAAQELLAEGLIAVEIDARGSAGFGASDRYVTVTDRGRSVARGE